MSSDGDARATQLRFRAAVDHLNARQFLRARRLLLRLRDDQPGFPWTVQEILQTYQRRGELEAGEVWLRAQLAEWPRDPQLHYGLGYISRRRGQPVSETIQHLRQALALDPECSAAATELGFIEAGAGDRRGQRRVERALASFRARRDRWGEATALNYLGHIARGRHDFATAHALYEQALTGKRRVGDRLGEAAALLSLGGLYFRSHDLGRALSCYGDALALQRATGDRFGQWHALVNLGALQTKLRDLPEAERLLVMALTQVRRLDHVPGIALTLDNLAIVLALTNRHARAARLLTGLLAVRERLPVRQLVSTRRVLGWVELERRRLAAAESHLTAAHELAVAHRLIEEQAHVAYELAALELARSQPAAALRWADASAALAARLTIDGDRPFVEGLRAGLRRAQALAALGETAAAWRAYADLLDGFDNLVTDERRDDIVMGLTEVVRETFDHTIALAFADPAGCGLVDPAPVTFAIAERARARALRQRLPTGRRLAARRRGPERTERALELGEAALRAVMTELTAATDDRTHRRLGRRRQQLRRELADWRRRQARRPRKAAAAIELSKLSGRLPAGTVVVAYHVGDRHVWAWVVTTAGVRARRLRVGARALARSVTAYLGPFTADAASNDLGLLLEQYDPLAARRLYQWLLAPVAIDLAAADHLIVIPDGPLCRLPFETLVIDDSRVAAAESYWTRRRFLIERWSVSYAPSVEPLLRPRRERVGSTVDRQPPRLRPLLALGDPQITGSTLPPLPASRREVESVAGLVSGAHLLVGAAATVNAYRTEAGRHRRIHLACHAVIDSLAPDYSGLVLAGDDGTGGDQILHGHEIAAIPLAAELVVVSGCQSGSGRLRRGEGVLSLARAFLVAGARATMVSLWNLHDASAAELMADFYSRLAAGLDPVAALRDARLLAIAAGRARPNHLAAHPYCWGAFVLLDTQLPHPVTDRPPGHRA